MGIRILEGTYDTTRRGAVLVDSVTDTAFGPLFRTGEHASDFLTWVDECLGWKDVRRRSSSDLHDAYAQWHAHRLDPWTEELMQVQPASKRVNNVTSIASRRGRKPASRPRRT